MNVAANRALPDVPTTSLLRRWWRAFGPFLGLLLVIGIFAIISDNPGRFLSPENLRIVFAQTVIVALGAIGMTIIIISGGVDLAPWPENEISGVGGALRLCARWSPPWSL